MKTRRSRKSFEPPPPPRRRQRNSRKFGKRGQPLGIVNETIVLSDSSQDSDVEEIDHGIEVVDIADVTQEEDQQQQSMQLINWMKNEDCPPASASTSGESMAQTPLSFPLPSPSPKDRISPHQSLQCPSSSTGDNEVPVINIGDDETESESVSQSQTQSQNLDEDDDAVEVVAFVRRAFVQGQGQTPNKRKRSSIGLGLPAERKSNGQFSMQGSIKRAKQLVRRSSSNSSSSAGGSRGQLPVFPGGDYAWNGWNSISANSIQIAKKKNRNKNRNKNKFKRPAAWNNFNFNRNRSREFNREVIFRPESSTNPVEGITVNVNNTVSSTTTETEFQPVDASSSQPFPGCSRVERRQWLPPPKVKVRTRRGPSPIAPGSNIMNAEEGVGKARPQGTLRPIVIDGSNVAVGHGGMLQGGPKFSARGIKICVDYFLKRGHQEIVVFVPRFRLKKTECRDPELLEELERTGHVKFTPSREAGGERIASYDDLFVVQYANEAGAIIISNDNFRDLYDKNVHFRETIRFSGVPSAVSGRLFCFVRSERRIADCFFSIPGSLKTP